MKIIPLKQYSEKNLGITSTYIMKISFYKSLSLFTIRQQLTIVYVIPLNKSKNLKFIWEYDDSFL